MRRRLQTALNHNAMIYLWTIGNHKINQIENGEETNSDYNHMKTIHHMVILLCFMVTTLINIIFFNYLVLN